MGFIEMGCTQSDTPTQLLTKGTDALDERLLVATLSMYVCIMLIHPGCEG